jgi:hypothetical protein
MPTRQVYPSLQADSAFVITPSNTEKIAADAGNTMGATFCYIKNNAASGSCKVMTARGETVTIYLLQGVVEPLAVQQVFATSPTPPNDLVAYIGHQR